MTDALRPIDATAFDPPAPRPDPGAVPMLQWVAIRDLVVDESYQRAITKSGRGTIAAIIAHFRWSRFSPVVVSPIAGGKFAVVDGQHRTTAAAALGFEAVPAQVIIADVREQADAFRAINGTVTRVSSLAVYHAAVAAGDPAALEVSDICARAGVTITRYPTAAYNMRPGECGAPKVLLQIAAAHGPRLLRTTLECVTRTANNVPGGLNAITVQALAMALAERPKLPRGDALLCLVGDIELEQELAAWRVSAINNRHATHATAFATHLGGLLDARAGARAA